MVFYNIKKAGNKMNLLSIGTSGIQTPYLSMGTWAIGGGTWWGENDDALSIRTIEAVSYTHLDVYKRQAYRSSTFPEMS